MLSPCNVWAVGEYGNTSKTLILHWNGASWKQAKSPSPGGTHGSFLNAVAAGSSTSAWAVGQYSNGTANQTLILRWNGTSWKQVTSPNPGGSSNTDELFGVATASSKNAWAVGDYDNGTASRTLIEHWNGTSWQQVKSPNLGGLSDHNTLDAVGAGSPTNVWAVGGYLSGTPQIMAFHCC